MTQGLYVWSKTAASNSNADSSINWAEGQSPSSVNDSTRAMMARTAEYRDDVSGSLTTGGISTAYTVATNEVFTSLALLNKQTITIVPHVTSGAAPTLTVDGLTAQPIRAQSTVVPPVGALIAGTPYRLTYYSATFEFIVDGAVLASAVPASAITNAMLANSAAWTLKGNNTSGSAAPQDFTIDALTAKATPVSADEVPIWDTAGTAMKKATLTALAAALANLIAAPTVQRFTSGSGTYTPTAGTLRIKVRMCGGGASGQSSVGTGQGGGGNSSFGGWGANGAPSFVGGNAGATGTGTLIYRVNGGASANFVSFGATVSGPFIAPGTNPFGGIAAANSGAGGFGVASGANVGGSGGAGEYVEFWMTAAQIGASQSYVIGAGGTGSGNAGSAGVVIVEEFYI